MRMSMIFRRPAARRIRRRLSVVMVAACIASAVIFASGPWLTAATPPAGSTIGNQASATYTDSTNTAHTATSNVTLTVIQQVASLLLTASQSKAASPGSQVVLPHVVTNTGNGADTFALSLTQGSSDAFDLTNLAIFADANGDGLPDNSTPITTTGLLAIGARFQFVIVGTVPSAQTSSQTSQVNVTATSTFDPARTATNTDSIAVSSNAVVVTTLSVTPNSGASPSGPYTFTLTFTNTGNVTATNLTLTNTLPAGLTYAAGSARWSVSGATALTDAAGGDPAGIAYDYGITQAGRLTAVVSAVASGQSGTLTFQANVPAGVAPGNLINSAGYTFNDGAGIAGPFNTNTVIVTVSPLPAVDLTGSTLATAEQGATVSFSHVVTNQGNGSDTFELTTSGSTFPAGTTFLIVRADGTTPMQDSNGNGNPDTGPLAPGANLAFVIRAALPTSATGGPYSVTAVATAASNPSVSDSAVDTLTLISSNTVDLTADVAASLGIGVGPEVGPVVTHAADPGSTVRFVLNVKNNSTTADTFRLDASAVADFSTTGLPAGWAVVYRDEAEGVVTQTRQLAAGGTQLLFADVTAPAGAAAGTQPVFFRVLSPTSGASDRLHDHVTVNSVRRLALSPNNTGQVFASGSVVYSHTLTNLGNQIEGDGTASLIALTVGQSNTEWTAVIYQDANNNGSLDAGESVVTDASFVSAGAAGLAPGESVKLLVKVFAPPSAGAGTVNTTTLTAAATNGTAITAAPAVVTATDASTVILSDVRIVKEQALDANGDGVPDTAFSTALISTGAVPGTCIRYRVTVTNAGAQNALNVVVNDVTPAYTTYHATVPAATTQGTVTVVPGAGATGPLEFTLGTLTPGANAVVTFGVRIDP